MAKRAVGGRRTGFYRRLVDDGGTVEVDCLVVVDEVLEEGVYKVERVVERRRKKVSFSAAAWETNHSFGYISVLCCITMSMIAIIIIIMLQFCDSISYE